MNFPIVNRPINTLSMLIQVFFIVASSESKIITKTGPDAHLSLSNLLSTRKKSHVDYPWIVHFISHKPNYAFV